MLLSNHWDRNRPLLLRSNPGDCVTSRILSLVLQNQLICARVVARDAACRTAISLQTGRTTTVAMGDCTPPLAEADFREVDSFSI